MTLCLGERLDGPGWSGLPLGRFAPPGHDESLPVASTQHTLFVWKDGASAATVQSRRGIQHYSRGNGVLDIMAADEEAYILHDHPEAPGESLLVALPHEAPAIDRGRRPPGPTLSSRFGFADRHLHDLALALQSHCLRREPFGRIYTESISLALSACVYAKYADAAGSPAATPGEGGLSARQRAEVYDYIEANLARDLSLAELAGIVGFSRPHFVRLFRRTFDASPHQFVMRLRVERAKQLLMRDEESLATIAQRCGFTDQSHLGNCFARSTGVSPGRFRRRSKSGSTGAEERRPE